MTSVYLRTLTPEERTAIEKIAHSRTAPACMVERAQIIWRSSAGEAPAGIAVRLHIDIDTVYRRIRSFNRNGLDGLKDKPRPGRPVLYTSDQIAVVVKTACTEPFVLGLPFDRWTLDRLAAYLHERKGISIQRSRIDEILLHKGLHRQKTGIWGMSHPDSAPSFSHGLRRKSADHTIAGAPSSRKGAGAQ